MAILNSLPGFEAEILVNGFPLKEHSDKDRGTSHDTVLKYVEATSGAEFAVEYYISPAFRFRHSALEITLSVDGREVTSRVVHRADRFQRASVLRGAREKVNGKYIVRKLAFSDLRIDDTTRTITDQTRKHILGLGTISLKLYWARIIGSEYEPTEHVGGGKLSDIEPVPEKALKGRDITHQARLKEPEPVASFIQVDTKLISEEPIAVFDFRYRSKAALQALCIIPRDPTPVPLEERDIDTLSLEETRELLKRQREREEAASKVKQESQRGVKRERTDRSDTLTGDGADDEVSFVSAKRRRTAYEALKEGHIEVVDLT